MRLNRSYRAEFLPISGRGQGPGFFDGALQLGGIAEAEIGGDILDWRDGAEQARCGDLNAAALGVIDETEPEVFAERLGEGFLGELGGALQLFEREAPAGGDGLLDRREGKEHFIGQFDAIAAAPIDVVFVAEQEEQLEESHAGGGFAVAAGPQPLMQQVKKGVEEAEL